MVWTSSHQVNILHIVAIALTLKVIGYDGIFIGCSALSFFEAPQGIGRQSQRIGQRPSTLLYQQNEQKVDMNENKSSTLQSQISNKEFSRREVAILGIGGIGES